MSKRMISWRQSCLFNALLLQLCMILLAGCSTVKVAAHKKVAFNRNESITVMCKGSDTLALTGELENLLLIRGYDVVSEDVARKLARTSIDVDLKNETIRGDIDQYNTTEVRSVYALTFNYSSRFDGALRERKIASLYASIIDLRTGRILKSLKLKRSIWALRGNDAYLERLIDQMEQ